MGSCAWPGADEGSLLNRLGFVEGVDWLHFFFTVLAAAGFGLVAGLGLHTVFRVILAGAAGQGAAGRQGGGA